MNIYIYIISAPPDKKGNGDPDCSECDATVNMEQEFIISYQ